MIRAASFRGAIHKLRPPKWMPLAVHQSSESHDLSGAARDGEEEISHTGKCIV